MADVVVRRATDSDAEEVTAVMASAFAGDPLMKWFMGEPSDPEARMAVMFGFLVRTELAKDNHAVEIVDGGGAAAVWHEIDDWRSSTKDSLRGLPAFARAFGRRLPRALRAFGMIEKAHPGAPHLYLGFIGVHAEHQGQGFGSALLRTANERLDREGLPAYLESSNPRNDALYARYGFESLGPMKLPNGAPVVTAMWRDPREP